MYENTEESDILEEMNIGFESEHEEGETVDEERTYVFFYPMEYRLE
jgi:hypothetical protein